VVDTEIEAAPATSGKKKGKTAGKPKAKAKGKRK
jgi:hypothetical protein